MRLDKITLRNFRSADNLEIKFHASLNVFYGVNGAGKTTILDACAVMLSWVSNRIKRSGASGRPFSEDDIKNGQSSLLISLSLVDRKKDHSWEIVKNRKGHNGNLGRSNFQQIAELTSELRDAISLITENTNIPLFAYYPINRNVLDIPLRIRNKHKFELLEAYDEALTSGVNFRSFFEWFRQREDLENEKRIDEPSYRDTQLQPVRQALEKCLPSFKDLRVRRNPLRMEVLKSNQVLKINQLSDGEKCLITLIGDIARRLAIANPGRSNPLEGEGVILIDEIDMHLHPTWQRGIIDRLQTTFPNCQFMISTHSPYILSHVKSDSLHMLELKENKLTESQPKLSYGKDIDRVLEDLMNYSPTRPQEVQNQLNSVFDEIAANDLNRAILLIEELEGVIGSDPELVKARIMVKRKRAIGK